MRKLQHIAIGMVLASLLVGVGVYFTAAQCDVNGGGDESACDGTSGDDNIVISGEQTNTVETSGGNDNVDMSGGGSVNVSSGDGVENSGGDVNVEGGSINVESYDAAG
ncbi:MAG: hypothetical protein AAF125_21610, partial [Chloroflexota bacterium]